MLWWGKKHRSEEGIVCCLLPVLKHFSKTVCQCQQNMYPKTTNCLSKHMSSYTNAKSPTEIPVSGIFICLQAKLCCFQQYLKFGRADKLLSFLICKSRKITLTKKKLFCSFKYKSAGKHFLVSDEIMVPIFRKFCLPQRNTGSTMLSSFQNNGFG